ncbi:hypothetical protein GVN18_43350 [Pseudomonas sp. ODNR1LW]|nr:hypothetical protein [Pseudomonas sp. ODNR1LW]
MHRRPRRQTDGDRQHHYRVPRQGCARLEHPPQRPDRVIMPQPTRRKTRKRPPSADMPWLTPAVVVFSLATSAWAGLMAAGLTWPAIPFPLALGAHYEQRADLALKAAGPLPQRLEAAAVENERTLALSPTTATAWMRAAYLRRRRLGELDAESLRYVETSYRVAPLGPGVSPWRILFVFENWPSVTPAIRSAALAELRAFARVERNAPALVDLIKDPAGRLAAKLALRKPRNTALQSRAATTPG